MKDRKEGKPTMTVSEYKQYLIKRLAEINAGLQAMLDAENNNIQYQSK
jgi:hypothetical protein